jgi:hypothetical protein
MPDDIVVSVPEHTLEFGETLGVLLFVFGPIFLLVFLCLGIETQRRIVFNLFPYPSVPTGSYSAVRVISSDRKGWDGAYVVAFSRWNSTAEIGEETPAPGILYSVECTPHFWNLCAELLPGQNYYARWSSSEHLEFAVGELGTDGFIDRKKTRFLKVRGWKKTED